MCRAWLARAVSITMAAGVARAGDGHLPIEPGTWLHAIPALEPVPEHAFGWTFAPPEKICRLEADSIAHATGDAGHYLGRRYVKIAVTDGTCRGEAGWIE
jgi:hypothetical protein